MSDVDRDPESATEEPSERRREEFQRRGDTGVVPDLVAAIAFLTGSLAAFAWAGSASSDLVGFAAHSWRIPALSEAVVADALQGLVWTLARVGTPVAVAALAGGVAASIVQAPPTLDLSRVLPQSDRFGGLAAVRRMVSLEALRTAVLGMGKIAFVGLASWPVLSAALARCAVGPMASDGAELPDALRLLAMRAGAALALGGVVDHLVRKRALAGRMRMTRAEALQERKQDDGDPAIRQRRREAARRMRRRKPPALAVASATVVITNPTHYAVAIRWKPGEMKAPKVVAKGTGELAARIRMEADRLDIPRIENPPLARALFRGVPVGSEIPPALYDAVARILAKLARRRAGASAATAGRAPAGGRPKTGR